MLKHYWISSRLNKRRTSLEHVCDPLNTTCGHTFTWSSHWLPPATYKTEMKKITDKHTWHSSFTTLLPLLTDHDLYACWGSINMINESEYWWHQRGRTSYEVVGEKQETQGYDCLVSLISVNYLPIFLHTSFFLCWWGDSFMIQFIAPQLHPSQLQQWIS